MLWNASENFLSLRPGRCRSLLLLLLLLVMSESEVSRLGTSQRRMGTGYSGCTEESSDRRTACSEKTAGAEPAGRVWFQLKRKSR